MSNLIAGLNIVCLSVLLQVALLLAPATGQRRRQSALPGARRAALDSNDILRGDVGDLQCAKLIADVKWAEASASARLPADPTGTWVSQRCETRNGPEFLLRKYTFHRNATFRLVQHFYADHDCSTPVFSVIAEGKLTPAGPSWTVPGATESDYVLRSVRVAAHTSDIAEALSARANRTCGVVTTGWRHGRWYDVYSYEEATLKITTTTKPLPPLGVASSGKSIESSFNNIDTMAFSNGSTWDLPAGSSSAPAPSKVVVASVEGATADDVDGFDCLQALGLTFDELQLLRVEVRKSGRQLTRQQRHWKRRKTELLMGEVMMDLDSGRSFRPTSYQQPLLRTDQLDSCALCRAINAAPDSTPPTRHNRNTDSGATTTNRPNVRGEWVSTRCETRPNSLFLTRRLQFTPLTRPDNDGSGAIWRGFYHFFGDPRCSRQPLFSLRLRGRYSLISTINQTSSPPPLDGATVAEFRLERIRLTPHTSAMAVNLNGHTSDTCGRRGTWRPSVEQDLSSTGGCSGLGLRVPSRQWEILRVETDEYGGVWLYLGQARHHSNEDDGTPPSGPLATSYQWPMLRCRTTIGQDDFTWDEDEDDYDQGQLDNDIHVMPLGGAVYSSRLDAEAPANDHSCAMILRPWFFVATIAIWWNWSQSVHVV